MFLWLGYLPTLVFALLLNTMNDFDGPLEDTIDLQDWLKLEGWVDTGGEAKFRVQNGEVRLNGTLETRRRKKLREGDVVEFENRRGVVHFGE